jgi:BirA family transcriptional regulator, biotin operon repressor / biotin---[acetyl-CoA-carboxylase] ligase
LRILQSYERKLYNIQPKTLIVGKTIKYLPTCQSTNDWMQDYLLKHTIVDGLCLYTSHQTQGRGQRGNIWQADAHKNITMSILLNPDFLKASEQFYLNMVVSLGVFDALEGILGVGLKIKWPNDIYFDNNKIGGILIENGIQGNNLSSSIIGIGINVNQAEFERANASAIKSILLSENDVEIGPIIEKIFEEIEKYYYVLKNRDFDFLKNKYLNQLFRIAEWHPFKAGNHIFNGKILTINEQGKLELETVEGLQSFDFKEIEFVI